jgi:protein ImuA
MPEQLAASTGFMAGVLSSLAAKGGVCLWINRYQRLFAPSLSFFNIPPHHIIFVDVNREKDILWVMEEALKCEGLTAVIAELQTITFAQSRRLQLAVERSKATGFILHNDPQKAGASTCVARWQVTSLSSETEGGLPGIGFPRWQVELLKVRNGKPGSWTVSWNGSGFNIVEEEPDIIQLRGRKAG